MYNLTDLEDGLGHTQLVCRLLSLLMNVTIKDNITNYLEQHAWCHHRQGNMTKFAGTLDDKVWNFSIRFVYFPASVESYQTERCINKTPLKGR